MYKLEDIKPKRYPKEKPSESGFHVSYRVLFDNGTQSLYIWNPISKTEGMMTWNEYVTWFIDIPNPPDELKFLAYPENKPEEAGLYLAHYKPADDWGDIYYPDDNIWDEHIDYFIPVRLDKENEMVFRENIWDTDEMKAEYDKSKPQMVALFDTSYGKPLNAIVVLADELTAFARHWLDLRGYNVVKHREAISSDKYDYKFALERIRTWTCNDGRGYEDPAALLENIDDYINKVLDVVKREPEIAPCPFCGGKCKVISRIIPKFENQYDDRPDNKCSVYCLDCKYFGPVSKGDQEAIRLHNLIADNALLRKESW